MVIEIKENKVDEKKDESCIIDFFTTMCPSCQMLDPVFEKVSKVYEDKLKFYKINIDQNIDIAEKYGIIYVPTLILFKNGNIINRISGYLSEKELIKFIDRNMKAGE